MSYLDARDPGRHLSKEHSVPVKLEGREFESLESTLHSRLHRGKQKIPHIPEMLSMQCWIDDNKQ